MSGSTTASDSFTRSHHEVHSPPPLFQLLPIPYPCSSHSSHKRPWSMLKTRLFLETVSVLQSWFKERMEVIIDYYGEEYPCYIYPDKTVKENIEAIAVREAPSLIMTRPTFRLTRPMYPCM